MNIGSFSLASELQNHEIEANTHDVKKGTLFDDESFIVRHGTEPNKLIAKAAGLEAFIQIGDAASLQAEQIQEWVTVPEPRKTLHGRISVHVILGVDNLVLPKS